MIQDAGSSNTQRGLIVALGLHRVILNGFAALAVFKRGEIAYRILKRGKRGGGLRRRTFDYGPTIEDGCEVRPDRSMPHGLRPSRLGYDRAAKPDDDRSPTHLGHPVIWSAEDMDIRAVPKVGKRVENGMKRPPLLERNKTWHVLDKHCSRLELFHETQVLAEQMVPWIRARTNRGVDREALTRGAASKQIKLPDLYSETAPDLLWVYRPYISDANLGIRMVPSVRLRISRNDFRGEQRMKASLLKTLGEAARAGKEVNACQLVDIRHFVSYSVSADKTH